MAVKNNAVLGYMACADCGERATVHRTSRGKARYLYKRCACGCDQRTGAAVQTQLFNNTQWRGEAPEPPPNLIQPKVQEPKNEPKNEPEKQPENEPKAEPETTAARPLLLAAATGLGITLLALMGRRL